MLGGRNGVREEGKVGGVMKERIKLDKEKGLENGLDGLLEKVMMN